MPNYKGFRDGYAMHCEGRHHSYRVVLALDLFDCECSMHDMTQGEPEGARLNLPVGVQG